MKGTCRKMEELGGFGEKREVVGVFKITWNRILSQAVFTFPCHKIL